MIDLSGKKIMVTGASSGIGRAAAILAAKCGALVVASGRDEKRLDETLSMCDEPGRHMKISFDVRDTEKLSGVFRQAVSDGKRLDGLVYSAGIAPPTPLRVMNAATIREVIDVNFIPFMMMTAMYAKRQYNNGGSIVGISSVNAHYPQQCMSAYSASKAAIESAAMTMAVELADKGIRINCIRPGFVKTPMTDSILRETQDYYGEKALMGHLAPEDVAGMIMFLLSDLSGKITGRSLYVDGGWLGQ